MPTVRGDDELDLELDLLAARHPVPPYSHDELFLGHHPSSQPSRAFR
jgi:hypothetical protein